MPKIEVYLSKDELDDLKEIVERGEAKDEADALKSLGFRTYHELKEIADKQRKEPAIEVPLSLGLIKAGFPTSIPCTMARKLKRRGLRYWYDFVLGVGLFSTTKKGVINPKKARKLATEYLKAILKKEPIELAKMRVYFEPRENV